eukprot:UN16174
MTQNILSFCWYLLSAFRYKRFVFNKIIYALYGHDFVTVIKP